MRNQFVADINDYQKYSLLNELSKNSEINVCWMLNPDIQGQDSKFVKFPIKDDLAAYLYWLVETKKRNVKYIESCSLIKVKNYYRQIHDIKINEINGILFFDPDNGIEVKSCKKGDTKYLFYDDINHFLSKVDVLIYQHFPRVPHCNYMDKRTQEIRDKTNCFDVMHFPQNMVDFILIKRNPVKLTT